MKRKLATKPDRVTAKVLNAVFNHPNRIIGFDNRPTDENLADLTIGVGQLAFAVRSKSTREIRQDRLRRIAALTLGWLERVKQADEDAYVLITAERRRQRELLRGGKFTLDVSHPTPDETRKLRILVEEVGEVAEAIDRIERGSVLGLKSAFEHLRDELVQFAAVAVAWLESLEVKS